MIWSSYRHIARVFKWLTLVLFAYVIAAFLAHPDWLQVLKATFVPHIQLNSKYLATFVGILGTTISPYLFSGRQRKKWKRTKRRGDAQCTTAGARQTTNCGARERMF